MRDSITRREWLARGAAAVAALGFGSSSLASALKPELHDLTPGEPCTLTCSQILGPCYYNGVTVRHDITEGKAGLPTLFAFLVVDATTCQPTANAAVDIWHTDAAGVYSAPIAQACNSGNALARTQTFLRGIQSTDAQGWAYFKAIYPGWYPGRTTHIHATIRVGSTAHVTTQFYFADALSDQIYANHPAYSSRPNRTTRNGNDGVIGGSASRVNPFLFQSKLIGDNSLVALKVIAIRNTPTTCNA